MNQISKLKALLPYCRILILLLVATTSYGQSLNSSLDKMLFSDFNDHEEEDYLGKEIKLGLFGDIYYIKSIQELTTFNQIVNHFNQQELQNGQGMLGEYSDPSFVGATLGARAFNFYLGYDMSFLKRFDTVDFTSNTGDDQTYELRFYNVKLGGQFGYFFDFGDNINLITGGTYQVVRYKDYGQTYDLGAEANNIPLEQVTDSAMRTKMAGGFAKLYLFKYLHVAVDYLVALDPVDFSQANEGINQNSAASFPNSTIDDDLDVLQFKVGVTIPLTTY